MGSRICQDLACKILSHYDAIVAEGVQMGSVESDERVEHLRRERDSLIASAEGIRSNFEALKEVETALHAKCQALDTQALRLLQERSRLEVLLAKTKLETANIHARALALKKRYDEEIGKRNDLRGKIQGHLNSIIQRRAALKNEIRFNHASAREVEKQAAELSTFERRLRRYASALNDRKKKIEISATEIAQEIGTSRALHPTRDYLRLVNEELEALDLRLKVSLPSSFERQHLENCMNALQEKKTFLEGLSQQTEEKLRAYALKVNTMYESVLLKPTPPLPPPPKTE